MKLNHRDLEKRTGVFTDDDGTHHDAMPNWDDVCPNCNNPHWAWFKKGEHIEVEQVEFVAEEDGKLCLSCGHKWIDEIAVHNDYSDIYSDYVDCPEGDRPPTWIGEIKAVAEANGYKTVYYPDRGGVECVGLTHDSVHFPSHICENVWEYLKQHGDAEAWLRLWLGACDYARGKRDSDGTL